MSEDKQNIVIGKAKLYIDGKYVGYTRDGCVFRKAPEYRDIEAQQLKGLVDKKKIMERAYVDITLLESTLVNIQRAFDDSVNATVGTQLEIGSEEETEHQLRIEGTPSGSTYSNRRFDVWRAVSYEAVEYSMDRKEETVMEVSFECLKDTNKDDKFGEITDYS
jgi:hypothetical protein